MYAIAFDLDTATLERTCPHAVLRNAHEDIRRSVAIHNFDRQQDSVYFGNAERSIP